MFGNVVLLLVIRSPEYGLVLFLNCVLGVIWGVFKAFFFLNFDIEIDLTCLKGSLLWDLIRDQLLLKKYAYRVLAGYELYI